jgi:hypothetical protein
MSSQRSPRLGARQPRAISANALEGAVTTATTRTPVRKYPVSRAPSSPPTKCKRRRCKFRCWDDRSGLCYSHFKGLLK